MVLELHRRMSLLLEDILMSLRMKCCDVCKHSQMQEEGVNKCCKKLTIGEASSYKIYTFLQLWG